ncbi:MAG TPA: ABC transporter ATP-binding protein [Actinomycetota bacterium]|nr:ABC transporter ATP-binding protein [Actinomycetota bacterium]
MQNLRKVFAGEDREVVALDSVSFEAAGHTFVSIVGPSGCGKSTLLNVLAGVESPSSGTVEIVQDGRRARIGYVFQAPRLLPWRSVIDNMFFVQKDRDERARERVAKYLDMVNLSDFKNAYPAQLSGGMQQRVGIARAFSIEPDALLMDEPFSHLDAITARSLRHQLHDMWKATGKTVLFVTHDVGEAVELSNRIIVFAKGGKIKEDLQIDLPFPRDAADENVAITKAHVLQKFEELELIAT